MYRHTQRSPALLVLFLLAGTIPLGVLLLGAGRPLPLGPRLTIATTVVVLVGSAVVFSSLTVRVENARLTWAFGPGVLRKEVPLATIARVDATTTFVEGWGIHLTRRGWLYNVSGRGAVLVTLHGGKRFLLGTDEPDELVRAIRSGQSPAA